MTPLKRFAPLRMTLVTVGVLVWVPYLIAKYATQTPFPAWWVLCVHVPCMVTALGLRLWDDRR